MILICKVKPALSKYKYPFFAPDNLFYLTVYKYENPQLQISNDIQNKELKFTIKDEESNCFGLVYHNVCMSF
jgi:hypothetical protein